MNTKTKISRNRAFNIFLYIFFFLMCACFVLPLIVVISASFTSEQALTSGGFSLLPRDFTLDAYKSAFSSGTRVLRAYGVTIFQAVVGTVLSSLVAALAARYPDIQPHLYDDAGALRSFINLYVGEHNIKTTGGLETPVSDGAEVLLVPAIAGGVGKAI